MLMLSMSSMSSWIQALNQHFLYLGLLAGVGIAAAAGPLGSLMVWRRLSNFGDTLAHAALLGVALSLLFHLPLYLGLFGVTMLLAVLLTLLSKRKILGSDTVLVILTHATLALGLILSAYLQNQGIRLDLLSYLYGDILAVTVTDLLIIALIDVAVFVGLFFWWEPSLLLTVNEDLAQVDGISSGKTKLGIFLLMALVFAVAVKLVGVLLLTALFIIPAAAARQVTRTPEGMAALASFLGALAVGLGIALSDYGDLPTGPAIVVVATILFLGLYSLSPHKT